jgi:hypothetical protein
MHTRNHVKRRKERKKIWGRKRETKTKMKTPESKLTQTKLCDTN